MTSEQAIAAVEKYRPQLRGWTAELRPTSTELAIVPYKHDPKASGVAELRVAWIVMLTCSWGYVRVDLEDSTGLVLNVIRSA